MARNYVIVRDPAPRLLPGFIRRLLGEQYLAVELRPFFTPDWSRARVFPSREWAGSYIFDRDGNVRPFASGAVIRATFREHSIPLGNEQTPEENAK